MDLNRHDFKLDDLVEKIKLNDNRLIALQVPEGLKMQALEMMDEIETETSAKKSLAKHSCQLNVCKLGLTNLIFQACMPRVCPRNLQKYE